MGVSHGSIKISLIFMRHIIYMFYYFCHDFYFWIIPMLKLCFCNLCRFQTAHFLENFSFSTLLLRKINLCGKYNFRVLCCENFLIFGFVEVYSSRSLYTQTPCFLRNSRESVKGTAISLLI